MTLSANTWRRWRVPASYPVGAACLLLARPTGRSIAWGAAIGAVGLIVRGWAAGHLRKGEQLTKTGPYAHTRNPLYSGSVFLATGFAIAARSWIATALLLTYFATFYSAAILREQVELREKYGAEFEEYAARVPLIGLRLRGTGLVGERFSWAVYMRNREYEAALGFAGGIALLVAILFWRA